MRGLGTRFFGGSRVPVNRRSRWGSSQTAPTTPPTWSAAPTLVIYTTDTGTYSLPVYAGGSTITVSWVSAIINGATVTNAPAWITLTSGATPTITFSGSQQDSDDVTNLVLRAVANSQTADSPSGTITVSIATDDWLSRISNPNVVWYHKFSTQSEFNQFRWTNGYGSGNDPLGIGGSVPQYASWHATGGPDNGPYISFYHAAAAPYSSGTGAGNKWIRPFSPLDGSSNGRGSNDPACSGTLPLQTFTPTPGGDETVTYSTRYRPGYYGKPEYQAAGVYYGNPSYPQVEKEFDGLDFYIQIRVKQDPAAMTYGNRFNGKFFFLTTTTNVTNCNQEVVTVSRWPQPTSAGPGQPNYHTMYEGGFGQLDNSNGSVADGSYAGKIWNPPVYSDNTPYGTGKIGWSYSGGWDTLLYHVTPGTANPDASGTVKDTRIEVWAAHEGETSYTKIWDTKYRAFFENQEQFTPGHLKYGWNALTLANYQNNDLGDAVYAGFTQSFAQIIFSKSFIDCPQALTPLEQRALGMVAGEWRELVTNNFTDMLVPTWQGGKTSTIIEFSDRMSRHDSAKRIYFIGCARGNAGGSGFDYQCANTDSEDAGYISYDEATNTWIDMPTANVCAAPHAYNGATIDQATGDYYQLESQGLLTPHFWKRAGGTNTWTTITYPPQNNPYAVNPIEWFPEIDALVTISTGDFPAQVHYMPRGSTTWTSINISNVLGQYGVFSRYSPQHQCVYFGGGEMPSIVPGNTYRVLYKFTASKTIVRCTDAPIDLFGAHMSIDPLTGNLLALDKTTTAGGTGRVYSFNGTSWAQHGLHGLSDGTGQLICTATPITSAGVVMFVNWAGAGGSGSKVYLYKHS